MKKIAKILLTGSTGMVGRCILFNKKSSNFKFLTPSRKKLNLLNYSNVYNYIKKNKPDIIIHAAGIVGGIHKNLKEPKKFLVENIEIGKNVILSAHLNKVKKMINLSSSCVYSPHSKGPLKENQILEGKFETSNEAYAYAKVFNTLLCNYINKENNKYNYKTLIPCNLFGEYDSFDPKKSHLVASIIFKINQAIKTKKKSVEIWGNGLSRREFMFTRDFSDFIFFSIKNFHKLPDNINVGMGYDFRIIDYYKKVKKVLNWGGNFTYNKNKPSGQKRKLLNIKNQKTLGWMPKYSLEKSIKITNEYYLKNEKSNN